VRDNRAWLFDASRHQECRPVDRVKAQDVFPDQVQRRPKFLEADGAFAFFVSKNRWQ